jgi:O-antigen ligase
MRSTLALPVAAIAFLSLVAFLPVAVRETLVPRLVIALVVGAAGLPVVFALAARGDLAARLGLAFTVWAGVATLASGSVLAYVGDYSSATGLVLVTCAAGAWGAGRALPEETLPWLRGGLVAGALVNGVVAILQGPFDLTSYRLELVDARSTGLLGNPVFVGAACASATTLLAPVLRRSRPAGLCAILVLATAVQMSGARIALAMLVVGVLFVGRACRPLLLAAMLTTVAVGLLLGSALQADGGTSAGQRLGTPAAGMSHRLANWATAADAVLDRPVTGWGPGRYQAGTSPHRTLEVADRIYTDAHNLVVEYAVTTGLIGAALLTAWLLAVAWRAWRPAQPDLAVAAALLFGFHLLEPQHVLLTPLMFLLAGAAAPRTSASGRGRLLHPLQAALVTAALLLGGVWAVGDTLLRTASLDFDLAAAERSRPLLRPWIEPLALEARIQAFRARTEDRPELLSAAARLARRAESSDPRDARRAVELAGYLSLQSRSGEAADAYGRALEDDPWSKVALLGRARQLNILGDDAASAACRRLARSVETRNGSGVSRSRSECLRP